jgi:hypothetical protein
MTMEAMKETMEAMMDAKINDERIARLVAERAAKEEFGKRIQEARTEFNEKLKAERTARLEAERRVVELTEKLDAERNARLDTEGRLATEVAELLRPRIEKFLVEELGVEQEARYDALLEGTNNLRVEQEARCDALQDKFAFLSSEINTLQDLALKNSSTLDAILERGDLTDKEITSLREWMGSMREGHVSLHEAFHAYQHHSNDMIAFFLERLTECDNVANQEDPQEPESSLVRSELPLEESQGSPAHHARESDSSSGDDSVFLSDDPKSSESEEEEDDDEEEEEEADDDGGGPSSNHENYPGSESDDEDEEAADDYNRKPDSGKLYYRTRYNWGWVDDDEEGTVG